MANFIHRWMNPHCPHCVEERVCKSCEVLKYEIERLRADNDRLMGRVLREPTPLVNEANTDNKISIPNKAIPWAVRRQALEAEDREKAKILNKLKTDDLTEKEETEKFAQELREIEERRNAKARTT